MSTDHQRAEELIPWYVNGTLNESELDFMNHHLETCEACRTDANAEVELSRQIASRSRRDAPIHLDFDTVDLPQRRAPEAKRPVIAALVVLLAAVTVTVLAPRSTTYTALTSEPDDIAVVQVVFAPETPEQTLRKVLLESGAVVIDGPSENGVYRLRADDKAAAADLANHLRASQGVRFAAAEVQP